MSEEPMTEAEFKAYRRMKLCFHPNTNVKGALYWGHDAEGNSYTKLISGLIKKKKLKRYRARIDIVEGN